MTTTVIILVPEQNHLDVRVDVVQDDGAVRGSFHLTHGQAKTLYVFDNQALHITEVAKVAKEAA